MANLKDIGLAFFDLCESGKGWQECRRYCHEHATFNVQAKSLEQLKTVEAYSNSMPHMFEILPDAHYELINIATDESRQTVIIYAHFRGTHTGISEPIPATGKSVNSDYVFIMRMASGKISEVTKVWNDNHTAIQLGWL